MTAPRALGLVCVVAAAVMAAVLAGHPELGAALAVAALAACWPRWGGPVWLLGVLASVLAAMTGAVSLSVAATAGAACVLLAGLSGASGVAVVGLALLLALAVHQGRGVGFVIPLVLSGTGVPLLLLGDHAPRLRQAWRPWVGTVGLGLLVTGLGFVLVPRVGVAVREGPALTGFQARVDLDDVSELFDDPTPIARVEVTTGTVETPLRLRGVALEHFDGMRWTAPSERSPHPPDLDPDAVTLTVTPLGDIDEGALFGLGGIGGTSIPSASDAGGNRWGGAGASEPYRVNVASPPPAQAGRWLSVPASIDPRIVQLAEDWAAGETEPVVLAHRFTGYLRDTALYTRHPAVGHHDPLADFLFGSRTGHCEHWATALAILLRAQGVPARPVNGFVDLEPDGPGWVVRRSHAHAWVEVADGDTWVVIDPTPGATVLPTPAPPTFAEQAERVWQSDVLGWDVVRQRQAARRMVQGIASRPFTVLGFYGIMVVGLLWRVLRVGDTSVTGAWDRTLRILARHGVRPPPSLPPVDAARWVREQLGDEAAPVEDLAWHLYAVRYGGEAEDPRRVPAQTLARELSRNLPRLCAERRSR